MEQKKKNKIYFGVFVIIAILALIALYAVYLKYNYNSYTKTQYIANGTKFTRDNKIKISKMNSYKLESDEYNDAMFYRTVKVEKNTPYRVTCMVKTENVEPEEEISIAGANISIADTTEKSKSVVGTKDWQKIELIFNSKNREEVKLGFRLGSYEDNCKGTAWFSDFTIEAGIENTDTEWNFAFLLIENTDVTLENKGRQQNIKQSMTTEDIELMQENIKRFGNTIRELSNRNMSANIDDYVIKETITSLSYDNENGYYVAPKNIQEILDKYTDGKEYDHIFVIMRLGDELQMIQNGNNDWIGLRRNGI